MANIILEAKSKSQCGENLKDVKKFKFEEAMKVRDLIDKEQKYWHIENLGLNNYVLVGNASLYGSEVYITKLEIN